MVFDPRMRMANPGGVPLPPPPASPGLTSAILSTSLHLNRAEHESPTGRELRFDDGQTVAHVLLRGADLRVFVQPRSGLDIESVRIRMHAKPAAVNLNLTRTSVFSERIPGCSATVCYDFRDLPEIPDLFAASKGNIWSLNVQWRSSTP